MFRGFGRAKFADGGSILGSSRFALLPHQLPLKTMLDFKRRQNQLKNNHLDLII